MYVDDKILEYIVRLGRATETEPDIAAAFPFAARALIEASQELYGRVARLQDRMDHMARPHGRVDNSPARALMDRLNTAF